MSERGLSRQFWCQQLPHAPADAMALINQVIRTHPGPHTLVGSSLGGLYASVAAQQHGLAAVLVNPAVVASVTLETFTGQQTNLHTGEHFEFTVQHVFDLRQLEATPLSDLQRYWLMLETGDEVLDYRAALDRFQGARLTLLEGGDHSFTRFADYLDDIICHAGLIE